MCPKNDDLSPPMDTEDPVATVRRDLGDPNDTPEELDYMKHNLGTKGDTPIEAAIEQDDDDKLKPGL